MELKKAIEILENNKTIKDLTAKGFFLCSCFSIIRNFDEEIKWVIHFYNPETKKTIDCTVESPQKKIKIGEEMPVLENMHKLDIKNIISLKQAIEIVKKNFNSKFVNIIISLHSKKQPEQKHPEIKSVWTINLISPSMTATTIDIDAETGKILSKKQTSLIKKFRKHDN